MKLLTCSVFLLVIGISPAFPFSIVGKVVNKLSAKDKDVKKGPQSDNSIHQSVPHGFVPSQIKFTSFQKCDPCPKEAKCVPAIQCPAHLKMAKQPQLCDLPGKGNAHGLCCTTGQNHTAKDFFKKNNKMRFMNQHEISDVMGNAKMEFKMMMAKERKKFVDTIERVFDPHHFHHMVFGNHRPEENKVDSALVDFGVEQMLAAKDFKDKQQLTLEESQLNHFDVPLHGSPLEKTCLPRPNCAAKHPRYRTFDGSCNHGPGRETWGAARTPMERLLPPAYEDGIWSPREHSVDGSKLNNPRAISRNLFPDNDRPHPVLNLMVMQFGQFLSHDFTQSSSITTPDGKPVKCCSQDGSSQLPLHQRHFACMPILIDDDDEFFKKFEQKCMEFVRLAITPDHTCKIGYAKTLSKVTHYIDGSAIYGSDDATARDLRSFKKGQLKMFIDFNRELLPLDPKSDNCMASGTACFKAGDVRVNQHTTLVAVHLLFAREHNRVAEALAKLNPHWSDDIIYEEARRIVIAEIQHITYNEWLPLIVGREAMSRFGLFPQQQGYSTDFDEGVNPSMTNEFTGAAFRFGHSTVQGRLFVEFERRLNEIILLSDTFNNPARFRFQHFYDEILRTLVHEPMQSCDNSVTFGLSRFLFRAGNPFGLDLVSLNIQRGRDEALRPYNDYLTVSGRKPVEDFHELGPELGEALERVYKSPRDIDLFVGGLLESSEDDAVVGPTFRDIIADQFSRLRRGDRYFYEHAPEINPGHFLPAQLDQIRKITLARIICDNSDHLALTTQSPNAFIQSNLDGNDPINCESPQLAGIDLSLWKD